MTGLDLISVFAIIAVAISLILAVFLLTVKTKDKLSNILLATFILINGIDLSMLFTGPWLQHYPGLLVFLITISLLNNPVFYLYALSICYSDFKLRPKHLLHAIPFILINLELVPRFYLAGFTEKIFILSSYATIPELRWMTVIGHLQFIGYIIGIFLLLKKYRKVYLENYADPKIITYRWLFQFALVDTIVHGIVLVKDVLKISGSGVVFDNLQLLVGINAVFILCWFVFKALYNPDLFRGVSFQLQPLKEQSEAVTDTETLKKIEILRRYMRQNEPYLEPSLTIQQLARQVKIPAKELSILINLYLGQHFFDFVNEYRIRKAMQLLKEDLQKERTVQEIFYEVGFNSKSSFNTAFKKHTAITPKEYRNNPL
jgi:AraC-like DNA-binding protein